jgi:hypothetical protein
MDMIDIRDRKLLEVVNKQDYLLLVFEGGVTLEVTPFNNELYGLTLDCKVSKY